MPIITHCQTCEKEVSAPPSQKRKYCSISCMPLNGENNPNWKGGLIEMDCKFCGKKFHVKRKEVVAGRGKFCSRSCSAKHNSAIKAEVAKNKRVLSHCKNCGKDILTKPSHSEKEGKFCSYKCRGDFFIKTGIFAGENNPRYSHGQSGFSGFYNAQRRCAEGSYTKEDIRELMRLQKGRCVNCMKKIRGKKYHADHIIPIARGGSNWKYNIQILCPKCNLTKSAKDPIEWAQQNGRLL